MLGELGIVVVGAVAIVLSVRMLLIPAISSLCIHYRLSNKAKGQVIGYATSFPEFVVVMAAAFSGVMDAGIWNIASSNIINCLLFGSAVIVYRQQMDLMNRAFLDEVFFVVISVIVPLLLFAYAVDIDVAVSGYLIVGFVVYKAVDRILNPTVVNHEEEHSDLGVARAITYLFLALFVMAAAGRFLGSSAEALVVELDVPAWCIGWVLGFITSIPEMSSFFEIYRSHQSKGKLHLDQDTQEGLDALVASNLSNLCLILPLGVLIYALLS